jgi:anti-sigma regulatory factor (Ser/Thr protein kinase)
LAEASGGKACRRGNDTTGKLVTMARPDRHAASDTPRRLDVRLRATPRAASEARRGLRQLALPLPLANDAEVAVSELVTNSVRHAGLGPEDLIRITIDWSGERLKVHVRDGGPSVLASPVAGSIRPFPGAESGWGLYLVDRLASRWGIAGGGYWFELRHDRPHPGF